MTISAPIRPVARLKTYTLTRDAVAFDGAGTLTQVPCGAEIEIVGAGFSRRTVKAKTKGRSYFFFLKDLEDGMDYPVNLYG